MIISSHHGSRGDRARGAQHVEDMCVCVVTAPPRDSSVESHRSVPAKGHCTRCKPWWVVGAVNHEVLGCSCYGERAMN